MTMSLSERARIAWRCVSAALTILVGALAMADMASGGEPEPGSYKVIDGKVDQNTFLGWRAYQSACHICHGESATGTDIAPSLLRRVELMTPREFAERVLVRYRLTPPTADASVEERARQRAEILEEVKAKQRGKRGRIAMPAWETDTQVNAHILDLYAYLSARANGVLGAGRPEVYRRSE